MNDAFLTPAAEAAPAAQRRAHLRHRLHAAATLHFFGDTLLNCRTTDLSMGGVGLEHDDPAPRAGTAGVLRFAASANSELVALSLPVVLRYTRFGGMRLRSGAEFLPLSPQQTAALRQVLAGRPLV